MFSLLLHQSRYEQKPNIEVASDPTISEKLEQSAQTYIRNNKNDIANLINRQLSEDGKRALKENMIQNIKIDGVGIHSLLLEFLKAPAPLTQEGSYVVNGNVIKVSQKSDLAKAIQLYIRITSGVNIGKKMNGGMSSRLDGDVSMYGRQGDDRTKLDQLMNYIVTYETQKALEELKLQTMQNAVKSRFDQTFQNFTNLIGWYNTPANNPPFSRYWIRSTDTMNWYGTHENKLYTTKAFQFDIGGNKFDVNYKTFEYIGTNGELTPQQDRFSKMFSLRRGDSEFCFESEIDIVNFLAELVKGAQFLKQKGSGYYFKIGSSGDLEAYDKNAYKESYYWKPDVTKIGLNVGSNIVAYRQKDKKSTLDPTLDVDFNGDVSIGVESNEVEYNKSQRTDKRGEEVSDMNLMWSIAKTINELSQKMQY